MFNSLKRFALLLGIICLVSAGWASAQSRFTVKGKVTDSAGRPIIGATVQIPSSAFGAVTNVNGAYEFSGTTSNGKYRVIASFIGYKQGEESLTVSGPTNATINFSLAEDLLGLGEVVVVGSTLTQEKKQLGNAITSIRADQIQDRGTGDVIQALQGKIPGAQITQNSGGPEGGISVKLRGAKSILSSSEPLYVIDGVVISNSTKNVTQVAITASGQNLGRAEVGQNRLADLNPNDIESIEVINGAAAAAIYGSRASNGVVLITTKRGKSGAPSVSFSTSVNMNQLRKKVYINKTLKQFGSADPATRLPMILANCSGALCKNVVDIPARYDYQDLIFRDAYGTDNNLSITGGTEKTKYFASFNYYDNQGIIQNTDYQRFGSRLRVDQKLNDWLSLAAGLNYVHGFSNEKTNGNTLNSPINSMWITNNVYDISQRDALGNLKAVEPVRINPLSIIEEYDITGETNRIIGDVQLTASPIEGLKISYVFGVDNTSQRGNTYMPIIPYKTQYSAAVLALYFPDGYAAAVAANTSLINNDLNAAYQTTFGDKLVSTTTVGYSLQMSVDDYSLAHGEKLAPFVRTVNGAGTLKPSVYVKDRYNVYGYFAQETLGYDNRLFITLAGRVDGSTVFAPENRNQFYPKASVSYVASAASFWGNSALARIFPQFKLRASYGQAGNLTGIGAYDRFYKYLATSFVGINTLNASNALANPSVRPERQTELELGADFTTWNERLGASFTWYNQDYTDLLIDRVIAPSQGGSNIRTNVGTLTNKGIEVALNANLVQSATFNWTISGVFSKNKNEVGDIGQALISLANNFGAPAAILKGESIGVFYGTYFARKDPNSTCTWQDADCLLLTATGVPQQERGNATTGTPMRDANGQPTGTILRRVIGNPNPDYVWSLANNFVFGKTSLYVALDAVKGADVFNADFRTRQGVSLGKVAEDEINGVIARGWIQGAYPVEEWRINDGSFVKVREVSISHSLGSALKGVRSVDIALVGRNLYSFDNYDGYDPETNAGGQSSTLRGADFGNVPIPRTVQLSVKLNF